MWPDIWDSTDNGDTAEVVQHGERWRWVLPHNFKARVRPALPDSGQPPADRFARRVVGWLIQHCGRHTQWAYPARTCGSSRCKLPAPTPRPELDQIATFAVCAAGPDRGLVTTSGPPGRPGH